MLSVEGSAVDTIWLGITVFCLIFCSTVVAIDEVFAEIFYAAKILAITVTLDLSEGPKSAIFLAQRDTANSDCRFRQ